MFIQSHTIVYSKPYYCLFKAILLFNQSHTIVYSESYYCLFKAILFPDNFKLIYYVTVDDPIAVEKCVQAMLCTIKEIITIFDGCEELIRTGKFPTSCVKCKKTINMYISLTKVMMNF